MMAVFRFYGRLNDFLPSHRRSVAFPVSFLLPGSVKDMIEAAGVPHPEVVLILANGRAVDFAYLVQNADNISVYPEADSTGASLLRAERDAGLPPCFVLDTHLGTLAGYLRMLGFDSKYRSTFADEELARVSNRENRILLTRDRGLLKRNEVIYGYYVRETAPRRQLLEVAERFGLRTFVRPFQRCIRCNGTLRPVEKDKVRERLPERTARAFDEFTSCELCGRIYWRGSHVQRMNQFLADVLGLQTFQDELPTGN